MIETVVIAGLVGAAVGVIVAKLAIASAEGEKATDAYEEGWSHGYDVGLQANRPKRTRKPKADA
jgi:hypothetical protein